MLRELAKMEFGFFNADLILEWSNGGLQTAGGVHWGLRNFDVLQSAVQPIYQLGAKLVRLQFTGAIPGFLQFAKPQNATRAFRLGSIQPHPRGRSAPRVSSQWGSLHRCQLPRPNRLHHHSADQEVHPHQPQSQQSPLNLGESHLSKAAWAE